MNFNTKEVAKMSQLLESKSEIELIDKRLNKSTEASCDDIAINIRQEIHNILVLFINKKWRTTFTCWKAKLKQGALQSFKLLARTLYKAIQGFI